MLVCSGVTLASFSSLWSAFTLCVKRIVNIMKVYIERKNMQVKLIPFRKNIDFIDFGNLEVGNVFMKLHSLLSVTCRHLSE